MGLAGVKVKQRFGLDPRNTNWSNDTGRFGHQYLEKMGWKPGKGLGLVEHATTSHIKVKIKDDNKGLGANLAKATMKDEFDSGECAGLDVFQRILGRLNGREDNINNELERQRNEKIINGKWGIHFVKGDTLESTWNSSNKSLKRKRSSESSEEPKTKRKVSKDDMSAEERALYKKEKKEKKEMKDRKKKEKKERKDKQNKLATEENSLKDVIENQKEKKRIKKERKSKDKVKSSLEEKKKNKKSKKSKKHAEESETKNPVKHRLVAVERQLTDPISTRLHVRSRWIKQKRAAVMDAKALNEIFMITN